MKKKIRYFVSSLIAVTLISVIAIVYYHSQDTDTPPYTKVVNLSVNSLKLQDIDELDKYVELVVLGYATEEFLDRKHNLTAYGDGYLQDFSTNTNIKIDKVLKRSADFPEDQKELTILEPVSLFEGEKITAENYIELEKDEPTVIFLMKNSFGDYSLVNDNLGKIMLSDKDPGAPLQALTRTELLEYEVFRNSVLEKYGLMNNK